MGGRRILAARIGSDGGPPAADEGRVPWWSFTKTALAAAALQLVGRGRLALDETVRDRSYTLRHLLQHRAGVPNYGGLPAYREAVARGDDAWEAEELLERVAADRLDFAPGTGWRYSNTGYLLVRRMIEEAAEDDLGAALHRLLFGPLGLDGVRLAATAGDLAGTVWGNGDRYDPGWVYHGLLMGSPGDAARFLRHLMGGDVLPRELLAEMTRRHPIGGPLPGGPGRPPATDSA